MQAVSYDALLLVSFGGPEAPDEVLPFLENVLRGRNVPRTRLLDVAQHYWQLGGVSPINAQNRALISALGAELQRHGPRLPIYWGNRNWRPLLVDTIRQMASDGVQRALAFVTSAYSSYSGCRQYREDIERAKQEAGVTDLRVDKLRVFFNHPGFIGPMVENVLSAFGQIPGDSRRSQARLAFTAHSIPLSMAAQCRYVAQLNEACRLVGEGVGKADWQLVYQSRSGPPSQPWLEPDVKEFLVAAAGAKDVVLAPIGFISDHMEVLYDLDHEAAAVCGELGLNMVRAATVGVHPKFVAMIRELILERMNPGFERRALGAAGPSHDVCPAGCCLMSAAG